MEKLSVFFYLIHAALLFTWPNQMIAQARRACQEKQSNTETCKQCPSGKRGALLEESGIAAQGDRDL